MHCILTAQGAQGNWIGDQQLALSVDTHNCSMTFLDTRRGMRRVMVIQNPSMYT